MFSGVFGSELVQDISKLPFGTAKDPIRQLILHATWQDLPEEIITDNDVHSDLDLMEAPAWSISTRLEDYPQGLLSEYLKNFHKICSIRLLPSFRYSLCAMDVPLCILSTFPLHIRGR